MMRTPSSRATMVAGTRPPRVMPMTAANGPRPFSRQVSARQSRWNWSHETGKIFSGDGAVVILLNLRLRYQFRHLAGLRPADFLVQRPAPARRVQDRERHAAPGDLRLAKLHQHPCQPATAMGGLDEHVEHVAALVLLRVGGMRRPVDNHQPDAGNGGAFLFGNIAEIAPVPQPRLDPQPER